MMGRPPALRQRLSDIAFLGDLQWDPAAVDACLEELFPAGPVRRQSQVAELGTAGDAAGLRGSPVVEQQQLQATPIRAPADSSNIRNLPSVSKKHVDASVQTATMLQVQTTEEYDGAICTVSYPLERRATCVRIIEALIEEEELRPVAAVPSHDSAVATDLDHRLEAIKSFRRVLRSKILQSEASATQQEHVEQADQIDDADNVG
jgi:hypothetical protein